MVIPDSAILIPPFLVAAIAGWLTHDGFPRWLNSLISFIVIVLVATIWALLSNNLVGSLWVDIAFIAALCAALVAGPLQPLQQWLTTKTMSPLAFPTLLAILPQGQTTRPMATASYRASKTATPRYPLPTTTQNDDITR